MVVVKDRRWNYKKDTLLKQFARARGASVKGKQPLEWMMLFGSAYAKFTKTASKLKLIFVGNAFTLVEVETLEGIKIQN
jgi:hypothetical protein